MAGMKHRLRALETENARLREALQRAREDYNNLDRYWREKMARFGAPYVASVVSRHSDGVYLAHQVVRADPTPEGLRLEIAA